MSIDAYDDESSDGNSGELTSCVHRHEVGSTGRPIARSGRVLPVSPRQSRMHSLMGETDVAATRGLPAPDPSRSSVHGLGATWASARRSDLMG
jgi:hypothetical protein